MPILADYHLHSTYSDDGTSPMEDEISRGIALKFTHLCFTEHMDYDYPPIPAKPEAVFTVDMEAYVAGFARLKEKYGEQIRLAMGIELGLQPHLTDRLHSFVKSYDFDFIIGSTHIANGKNPYLADYHAGRSDKEAYREYFEAILENIQCFADIDVCGHLDYAVRYGPNRDNDYHYRDYADVFDEILTVLVNKSIGLEINTSGLRGGLREPNPALAIVKRYRELGGEIITVGSDAHRASDIGYAFGQAEEFLKVAGFDYITVFEKRETAFVKI